MAFDYSELRKAIKTKYGTQDKFAKVLGVGRVSLSHRLNNRLEFKHNEIDKTCELLEIEKEEIPRYFFKEEVQKNELKTS